MADNNENKKDGGFNFPPVGGGKNIKAPKFNGYWIDVYKRQVGTCPGDSEACPFRLAGVTVSVHVKRQPSLHYIRFVTFDTLQKTRKFFAIVIPWHIEHVFSRHEAESVDRVGFLLRKSRKSCRCQPRKQNEE